MRGDIRHGLFLGALLATACGLSAQTFQLVMCDTPVGTGSYQPVERFVVGGTNGPLSAIPSIPANLTNDPTFPAFNSQYELFISNRHGHAAGSVSRFTFDPSFGVFTPNGTITGNGLFDAVQLTFNPIDGELFVGNWTNRTVSRFTFNALGAAVPNGTITVPDASYIMGVAIRSVDQQLIVGSHSFVRRFARQANGSYVHLGNFTIPGATSIHGISFRGDELFVCDISTNQVYRFTFNASGVPVANGSIPCTSPICCTFSPDGEEMFVARHYAGGMQRFLRSAATNTWTPSTILAGPAAGGIAATIHTFSAYGQGCPGTGNQTPTLQGYGMAYGGGSISLRTQLGLPNTYATVVLSLAQGNAPILGCTWWQSAIVTNTPLLVLDSIGRTDYPIPIPVGLARIDMFFQSFVLDYGAPNGLFSSTAGLRASIL